MKKIILSLGLLGLLGCQSQPAKNPTAGSSSSTENSNQSLNLKSGAGKSPEAAGSGSWTVQMRSLDQQISELLPMAFDSQAFRDSKNEQSIKNSLQKLNETAKAIQHSPMQTLQDPSLNFISYDFHEQVKLVQESFIEGKKDFARYELIKTTNYCIECHTRTTTGPSFGSEKFQNQIQKLKPLDKAEYMTATRRFDQALELYMEYFKGPKPAGQPAFQAEKAALQALAISVRFQESPEKAMKLAKAVQGSVHAPYYLSLAAQNWDRDIQVWKKEISTNKKLSAANRDGNKPNLGIEKGWIEKSQLKRFEHGGLGGEVYALRAISNLNLLLPKIKKKEDRAEAFYLLGQAYLASVFSEHANVGEKYLESCIRSFPKTPWAKKCYQKLEEVTYASFTGSAGTFLPVEEEMKLQELFKMTE